MRRRRRGLQGPDVTGAPEPRSQSEHAIDQVEGGKEKATASAAKNAGKKSGHGAAFVVVGCVIVFSVCTAPWIVLNRPHDVRSLSAIDNVLRDAMVVLELCNLKFWLMQRTPSIVLGVQAASAMQIAEAQLALLLRGWITEDTNYGFTVCADPAGTAEPR